MPLIRIIAPKNPGGFLTVSLSYLIKKKKYKKKKNGS